MKSVCKNANVNANIMSKKANTHSNASIILKKVNTHNNASFSKICEKIQKQLCYMIPERWSKIYLYASISEKLGNLETGEMFFYYFPKGILKKNAVNSYEIPTRFNIEEESYLKLADKLYELIKELKIVSKCKVSKTWHSVTIKIEKTKFNIEFHHENLEASEKTIEAKRILWVCKNLNITINSLSKNQRQLLTKELAKGNLKENVTIYEENIYQKPIRNVVKYNKEQYISESEMKLNKHKQKIGFSH